MFKADSLYLPTSAASMERIDAAHAAGVAALGQAADFKVFDDGEDTPVVIDARRKAELVVDAADVVDDGALGHGEVFGDGGVRSALGDQGEDGGFPRGQVA